VKSYFSEQNRLGSIRYNEDVIRSMVDMALSGVEGVAATEGRAGGGILGHKSLSHINKITVQEKKVVIDLSIVVRYGLPVQDVARRVQQKVRDTIESMTDLRIGGVNITVSGLELQH